MCQPADSVFYGLHIFVQRKSIKAKGKLKCPAYKEIHIRLFSVRKEKGREFGKWVGTCRLFSKSEEFLEIFL